MTSLSGAPGPTEALFRRARFYSGPAQPPSFRHEMFVATLVAGWSLVLAPAVRAHVQLEASRRQ